MALVFANSLDDESDLGCTVQVRLSAADRGRFRLRGLAPADYRVYAEALDRQSDEIRVRANEGTRPEKVDLVLRSLVGRGALFASPREWPERGGSRPGQPARPAHGRRCVPSLSGSLE
jgi:hypothetical protein